jgi:altronate dehydratase small subunit
MTSSRETSMGYQAVVINEEDNVATALTALSREARVSVEIKGRKEIIILLSDIPMGHKFALRDIEDGEAVIKYGEPIGRCTVMIRRGEHVHAHNLVSPTKEGVI